MIQFSRYADQPRFRNGRFGPKPQSEGEILLGMPRDYDRDHQYVSLDVLHEGDTFTEVRRATNTTFVELRVWAHGYWHIPVPAKENAAFQPQERQKLIGAVLDSSESCDAGCRHVLP